MVANVSRVPARLRRLSRPTVALALICLLSIGARVALIGEPCKAPCRLASDHLLIFDENYYVNAARVIAGVRPPPGVSYSRAPLGADPNAEHPQLAKLIVAGSIELFGDDPIAWRLGSLIFGTLAILGMFALARAAGASPWVAVGAAALCATDNLLLVHSRIATLDVFAVTAMIWGAVLYLRRRPLWAGAVIGLGACMKVVDPYVLLSLVLLELISVWIWRTGARRRLLTLAGCMAMSAATFIVTLAVCDRIARPYDDADRHFLTGGVFGHISHMISYAASQVSPDGPMGIASYPWQWLYDMKWITYLTVNPSQPSSDLPGTITPAVHFLGLISPPTLLAGMVGLIVAAVSVVRRRLRDGDAVPVVAVAWFLGTWLPFLALSLFWQRTSYLYYMVIVTPGLYLVGAWLIGRLWRLRWLAALAVLSVAAAAVLTYPFTPNVF